MNQDLLDDLKSLRCEGNEAFLPDFQLKNYAEMKKFILKACGKYNRNKFVFPFPAKIVIDRLISGEVTDFKKEFQFFATPKEGVQEAMNHVIGQFDAEWLEPSAGHGAFIDAILDWRPCAKITAVEISDLNFAVLQEKYKDEPRVTLIKGDFLELDLGKKFDVVIGNPPFNKNQDIAHVRKMIECAKPGGDSQVISYTSNSWRTGNQKVQKEFRDFATENLMYYDIDKGTFRESGTMVSTTLVIY